MKIKRLNKNGTLAAILPKKQVEGKWSENDEINIDVVGDRNILISKGDIGNKLPMYSLMDCITQTIELQRQLYSNCKQFELNTQSNVVVNEDMFREGLKIRLLDIIKQI